MAQLVVSWLVDGGRFRVHAVNAVGRRKGRIIEVEEVENGRAVPWVRPKARAIGADASNHQW